MELRAYMVLLEIGRQNVQIVCGLIVFRLQNCSNMRYSSHPCNRLIQ